ncbi:hypothetical protein SAY87_024230 [Trapa incisa]|uniref:Cytochrome b561 domain-containing protein n=1 Tax=Trapa incisa TaxID=236973 RepID=A0AAN7GKH7_9MYRT|nr:hypothetical protein SAY87_024230 [Trapa incisa]
MSHSHRNFRVGGSSHKCVMQLINPKLEWDIALHGLLFWASMGFLMPVGIIFVKMSALDVNQARRKALFYVHAFLQGVSVVIATAGAILSLRSFENSFNNHHQRIGLVLYVAIWIQAIVGLLRPRTGAKRRTTWYLVHWILGTAISLLGVINIYSGIIAYRVKTSKGTWLWSILFTAQVSLIAFLYLFIDKWVHLQEQNIPPSSSSSGSDSRSELPVVASDSGLGGAVIVHGETQKQLMVLEPCSKRNALRNLFD